MVAHDAIKIIKEDHLHLRELFTGFEELGRRAYKSRRRVADEILRELAIHASIEETVLYPRIRQTLPDEAAAILEALEEHHLAKLALAEIDGMDPRHERFTAKMTVLRESVFHHMAEEERDLLPALRKALSREERHHLGEELEAAREVAPTHAHPHAPDEPPANLATALVSAPIDRVRNKVKKQASRQR